MASNLIKNSGTVAFALVLLMVASGLTALLICPASDPPQVARGLQIYYPTTVNVTVTDNVGRPVPFALIKAVGNGTSWQTGPDGSKLITDLFAEETGTDYTFWANKTGYLNSTAETRTAYANQTVNATLVLQGGTIIGSVLSSTGPIANATVSISSLGYSVNVSNSDGSYQLAGVPGGTLTVLADASGYVNESRDVRLAVGDTSLANFILISQNGTITGFVLHERTGVPLNNTNVSMQVGATTLIVPTDSNGSYNITSIPEGTYSLTASREGFFSNTSVGIQVTRGMTSYVNFSLAEKPTRLYGIVKSGSFLLVGVNISVVGTGFYNISGVDGNFEIGNISAGTYTVLASRTGYYPKTIEDVVVPAGGETQLNVNLTAMPGSLLQGTVIAADTDSPLPGVLITIIGENKNTLSTYTNINGEFVFPGLTEGNYTIQFEKEGYRPLEIGHLEVREDDTTNHRFIMNTLRRGVGEGFIFGFDMAHSMMILALFLTIVILAVAIYLRIRTFQAPESAPAVYDEAEELVEKEGEQTEGAETAEGPTEGSDLQDKKVRKIKKSGD